MVGNPNDATWGYGDDADQNSPAVASSGVNLFATMASDAAMMGEAERAVVGSSITPEQRNAELARAEALVAQVSKAGMTPEQIAAEVANCGFSPELQDLVYERARDIAAAEQNFNMFSSANAAQGFGAGMALGAGASLFGSISPSDPEETVGTPYFALVSPSSLNSLSLLPDPDKAIAADAGGALLATAAFDPTNRDAAMLSSSDVEAQLGINATMVPDLTAGNTLGRA